MNKYNLSAQYVTLLLAAELCNMIIALLQLAFSDLAPIIVMAIRIPLVGIYFYTLISLADKFSKVFTVSLVCYITYSVLMLTTAFVPNSEENRGLLAFLNIANEVLVISGGFFVLTGFLSMSKSMGDKGLSENINICRFAYFGLFALKTLMMIFSVNSTASKLVQVAAILMDVFILNIYNSLRLQMRTHREKHLS